MPIGLEIISALHLSGNGAFFMQHAIAAMRAAIVLVGLSLGGAAQASETTTYSYDALGRLTGVQVAGGPSDGRHDTYSYDAAGNRTQTAVTGARPPVVVVPLNGYTVIPLPD
ncbi:RHS repeat domain-containing protein [uncultured Sphingomonas sp.]|uniref:RHS repeat domain-containing protein n=1 Tax=uncultured Sphingomonas sp. TaxID=158754 RepID=UPI0035CBDFCB